MQSSVFAITYIYCFLSILVPFLNCYNIYILMLVLSEVWCLGILIHGIYCYPSRTLVFPNSDFDAMRLSSHAVFIEFFRDYRSEN